MEPWQNRSIEDLIGEIWKPVVGMEESHLVSNFGRIKSVDRREVSGFIHGAHTRKGRIIKINIGSRGYVKATLQHNREKKYPNIHRVVAEAFIPNPQGKPHINHKNGNKIDNRIENLEWCTQSENQRHAYDTGLNRPKLGTAHHLCTLPNEAALDIIQTYAQYKGQRDKRAIRKYLSEKYGISDGHVKQVALGFKRAYLQNGN